MATPLPSVEQFHALCEARRSIRYFSDVPVDRTLLQRLLETATLAPNIENIQPWHFTVVYDAVLLQRLMEASCYGNFVLGAGVVVVVSCDINSQLQAPQVVWNPRELEYSCMAAMDHLLLAATAAQLGSCWVSLHHGTAHDVLQLPRHRRVVGAVMIGHYRPDEELPSHGHQRRSLSETITTLG
jgi:nitroreductase